MAAVPAAWIHAPWEMPPEVATACGVRLGIEYPDRVVDHAEARVQALAAFRAARHEA